MMEIVKKLMRVLVFLAIGFAALLVAQDVLSPDDYTNGTPEKAIKGYWAMDDDTVDVLILGSSHPEFAIYPMQLYEETGIVSYNLATGNQPIEVSYYMLKEALKTQTPKAVILDPSGLFGDENADNNGAWRLAFDKFPLDDVKLELAADYGKQSFSDGYLSVFFPIIKFHDRWSQLSKEDFAPHWRDMYYTAGGLLVSYVRSTDATYDRFESDLHFIRSRDQGFFTEFDGESKKTVAQNEHMFYPVMSDSKKSYFYKIKELCDNCGAELILVTIPTLQVPWAKGGWNTEKSGIMKAFAAAEGVVYIDMVCDYDEIDYMTDSFDAGMHMNCRGAEKVTHYLGEYLKTRLTPSGSYELYDSMAERYDKALDVAMLESEKDFYAYIERLKQYVGNYTIFIAAKNEYTLSMTADDYAFLQGMLGLELVQNGGYADAYLAVIDKGELIYEALSGHRIDHKMMAGDLFVNLCSSGWFDTPEGSIKINGVEYIQGGRGLNIVVYDNESGLVIDSVSFDTLQSSKPALRNWGVVDTYLRAYEAAVCF